MQVTKINIGSHSIPVSGVSVAESKPMGLEDGLWGGVWRVPVQKVADDW